MEEDGLTHKGDIFINIMSLYVNTRKKYDLANDRSISLKYKYTPTGIDSSTKESSDVPNDIKKEKLSEP